MSTKLIRVDLAVYLRVKGLSEEHGRSMSSIIEHAIDGTLAHNPYFFPHKTPAEATLQDIQRRAQALENRPSVQRAIKNHENPSVNLKVLTYEPEE